MRLTRRDNQIPQNLRIYALCEWSKTLWSTFDQLITSLYPIYISGGEVYLCKVRLEVLGGRVAFSEHLHSFAAFCRIFVGYWTFCGDIVYCFLR